MPETHGRLTWSSGMLQEVRQGNDAARTALLHAVEGLSAG